MDRRHFFAATAATAAATAAVAQNGAPKVKIGEGDVVLFQGDSITDAGRDRKSEGKANDARMLGRGYPHHLAGDLLEAHAALGLKVYNRGISGHKVPDLDARWQKDTLDLKPTVLSILIGVNDIWHKLNGNYDGTPEVYRDGFAALLARTKKALPDVQLVICEPFALRCGAVKDNWYPEMDERRAFAKEVSDGAGVLWVPFQTMFDAAIKAGTKPEYWAGDGVHPSVAGHALMAKTWRAVTGI
ncbi:MAG: lysophospholipase L1-like esterase [Verrucomicrobiales bacterium]|jgi:lysophospholipase L1-like esterase